MGAVLYLLLDAAGTKNAQRKAEVASEAKARSQYDRSANELQAHRAH